MTRKLSYYQSAHWMKKIRNSKGVSKNAGMKHPRRKIDRGEVAMIRQIKKYMGHLPRKVAYQVGQMCREKISARQVYKIAANQAWRNK